MLRWNRAVFLALLPLAATAKPSAVHVKWGQTKESLFISCMVRDLDSASVEVSLPSQGDLSFRAKNVKGEAFGVELPLREDVDVVSLKWEVQQRSDKWGTAVLVSLVKKNKHRWDLLVTEPKKFKGLIDKDWSREDQTLEPEDETPYAEDNEGYISELTAKNREKTVAKFAAVVVNVRYPWCSQCKSQDETFAKAAKAAKARSKKDAIWKKVSFAVVDAREQNALAREFGAKCDYNCEYKVLAGAGEEPTTMKSKFSEDDLLGEVKKYLTPAVTVLKSFEDVAAIRDKNTTCFGGFESEASPTFAKFKRVASLMRGELVFVATFGEHRKAVELWPHGQNFSFKYDGKLDDNGTAFFTWVQPRSIPLLQEYSWQQRETYEKLGLPLAKVWINDKDPNPTLDKTVRYVVRKVAKRFIGRIAFVEQKSSTYSYELRDYGLNHPEVYPAFGIASNATYTATKYGFEVTPEDAASAQEFWASADKAISKLADFCEVVLAGSWPEAHESSMPHSNWTEGEVKRIVWKTRGELDSPKKPLLLSMFGKYRAEQGKKITELTHLGAALASFAGSLTVASYDTADNFVPPEFKREKYGSDTEWYFLPTSGPMKKLTKPKKDADVKTVMEFAKKQAGLDFDVEAAMAKFEELMKEFPPDEKPPMPDMGGMGGGMGGMPGMGDMGGLGGMGGMPGMGDMGGLGGMDGMPDMGDMGGEL